MKKLAGGFRAQHDWQQEVLAEAEFRVAVSTAAHQRPATPHTAEHRCFAALVNIHDHQCEFKVIVWNICGSRGPESHGSQRRPDQFCDSSLWCR